jgi:subtilisin family serine protease
VKAAATALLLALVAGCATSPSLPPSATLPVAVRAAPGDYLVVTVRNPVVPAPLRAASTPRGYDGVGLYIAGGEARATSRALAADYGLKEVSSWPIALLGVHCLVYGIPAGSDAARITAALQRDRRVESVQPLQAFDTQSDAYNDPYAQLQQNVTQMAISDAHAFSRGGGVRIAVIDTGADVEHPDLRPHATRSRNFVDGDAAGFRADAHGTAVAGVIGAVPNNGLGIVGIAPDVELAVYKACWRATTAGAPAVCNTFTLAQALSAAIEAHADIINLSLGGPSDPLLTRLVKRGLAGGAIVVGAMPRAGTRTGFPVEIDGVIAADTLEAGSGTAGVVRAPGRDVLSLAPEGHYDFFSGSSLAAAEVSGLIALLKSERPRLSAREAEALLNASTAGGAKGPNACAALAALLHRGQCGAAVGNVAVTAQPGPT